jgi:cyclohexa-1,5-dienecarbonyl-CoA hydratase
VDGAEALRIGLVNAVAPDPEAAALAYYDANLAGRSASSLAQAVRAARLGFGERIRAKLAAVEQLYLQKLMQQSDPVEGLKSFLEKRPPRWEDR